MVIACRDVDKGRRATAEIAGSSVRSFAESVKSVDVLVNNAGVMGMPLTH